MLSVFIFFRAEGFIKGSVRLEATWKLVARASEVLVGVESGVCGAKGLPLSYTASFSMSLLEPRLNVEEAYR